MSIINGVVPMNVDHTRHEEPSTPSKDPLSSPAVHIQWQNSQSACAAMEELRAASSMPRRPPKPLTFDFELPASATRPSSSITTSATTTTTSSDPFIPSRARSALIVRSRALGHVQSHSQNDVPTIPSADASNFLDMLGRASARVDENSRKRMRVARSVRELRSPLKGKERGAAGTRSLDELHDHTNLVSSSSDHRASASGMHYSSLPIMPPKLSPLQAAGDAALTDTDADNAPIMGVKPDACSGTIDNTGNSCSTRARSVTLHVPLCFTTTKNPQGWEPPSPTPARPAPTILRPQPQPTAQLKPMAAVATSTKPTPLAPPSFVPLASACPQHPIPTPTRTPAIAGAAAKKGAGGSVVPITPESLPRRGSSASTTAITASQLLLSSSQGPRRALGMTRNAALLASASTSSSNAQHSAAVKRPFRPPRVQALTKRQSQQQRQKTDSNSPGSSDPDSSFDLAFDFDPEALEAAMKPYD